MSKTKKHLLISFATQYFELGIQFIAVLILARLLSPAQVGTYSVAAFLMTLLHVFRDFGVAKYVIQEPKLSNDKIRSAFGVAIMLAWAVATLLFLCSGYIARLYKEPEIERILVVMSFSFAITPLGSLLSALFTREMQFGKILVIRVSSALCHVTTAVSLAYAGYGAISLAWANFAGILSYGVVANLLRPPGLPWLPRFRDIREILSFGSISSVGNMGNVASTNAPDVVIGKVIDLAAAGYYSRANGLIQLFRTLVSGTVMPLILPYFSKLRRENGDASRAYRLTVEYLTVFAWPFFAVMAVLAFPVVRTLYGEQWDASVPVVRVLCVAGSVAALSTFAGDVMIANGNLKEVTISQLVASIVRIAGIVLCSSMGLLGIAAGVIVSECLFVWITSHYLQRTMDLHFKGILRDTAKSGIVTLLSAAFPALIAFLCAGSALPSWLVLALGLIAALTCWIAGIYWTGHPIKPHLQQVVRAVSVFVRKASVPN